MGGERNSISGLKAFDTTQTKKADDFPHLQPPIG